MTSQSNLPSGVSTLEAELGETLKAVTDCFAFSRSIDREADEYGHRRAREITNAVELLKVSAGIGLAIAKINGDTNHNINVLRGEIWPPPRTAVAKPETFEEGRPTREEFAKAVSNTKAKIDGLMARRGTPSPES